MHETVVTPRSQSFNQNNLKKGIVLSWSHVHYPEALARLRKLLYSAISSFFMRIPPYLLWWRKTCYRNKTGQGWKGNLGKWTSWDRSCCCYCLRSPSRPQLSCALTWDPPYTPKPKTRCWSPLYHCLPAWVAKRCSREERMWCIEARFATLVLLAGLPVEAYLSQNKKTAIAQNWLFVQLQLEWYQRLNLHFQFFHAKAVIFKVQICAPYVIL